MTPPSATDYALAKRSTGPALLLAGLGTLYLYGTDPRIQASLSWIVPFAGFALVSRLRVLAVQRVAAYETWNREWRAMAGEEPENEPPPAYQREPAGRAPGQRQPARPDAQARRKRMTREWVGVITWCALAWWLGQRQGDSASPDYLFALAAFALLTIAGVAVALLQLARGLARLRGAALSLAAPARSARDGTDVVTVCLPVARSSPTVRDACAGLPDYCRALMRQSNASPHPAATPAATSA